jgi:DNA-binding NtrC family response regulator
MPAIRILAIDDDPSGLELVMTALQQPGVEILGTNDPEEGLTLFEQHRPEVVLVDMKMPKIGGMEILSRILGPEAAGHRRETQTFVIMLTAFGTVEAAVGAMKAGAYDYLTKPVGTQELRLVVARALEHAQLRAEVRRLRSTLDAKYGFESILGRSKRLLAVLDLAARAAQTTSTVLIRGETGTGKELIARAIHFNSPRKDRPFVTINCGAIPKDLLESELFGHVKGSFTGAVGNKTGKVEAADGGTLFLDEIGDMPLSLQVKLLRLLQNHEIEKVGATGPSKVDARIIAATHRNLQAMIERETFREDLYYRLSVIPLELPPLRERPDDIPELVRLFFQTACERHGKSGLRLPEELMARFTDYLWPGNVRELENVIERLVVLSDGELIRLSDMPDFLQREVGPTGSFQLKLPPEGINLENLERDLILKSLEKFEWNQSKAAKYLGLSRKTLIYRMEKFGLKAEQPGSANI